MKQFLILSYILLLCLINSCSNPKHAASNQITIAVQPFSKCNSVFVDSVAQNIERNFHGKIILLQSIELPKSAFTNLKTPRYRADTLLKFLQKIKPTNVDFIIGITDKDISTTKKDTFGKIKTPIEKYNDFGVFGLGFRPGNASIISSYRLKSNNKQQMITRLQKISTH